MNEDAETLRLILIEFEDSIKRVQQEIAGSRFTATEVRKAQEDRKDVFLSTIGKLLYWKNQ